MHSKMTPIYIPPPTNWSLITNTSLASLAYRVALIPILNEQGATPAVRASTSPAALPVRIVRAGTIRRCRLQAAAFLAVQDTTRVCWSKRSSALRAPPATFRGRSRLIVRRAPRASIRRRAPLTARSAQWASIATHQRARRVLPATLGSIII